MLGRFLADEEKLSECQIVTDLSLVMRGILPVPTG